MTFVELLMAVSIAAILWTGLSTHLRGGITAWRRVIAATDELARSRAFLDQCARELAQSIRCDLPAEASASFRYGYAAGGEAPRIVWRPAWRDATRLPRLVEITIGDGPARLRQVVAIPTGALLSAGDD